MNILFLHGWQSTPGGRKPTYLSDHGHTVLNPALPDDDFDAAVRIAQAEYDEHQPDVVVGSSRGGAIAMNMESGDTPLVLLCPAWKRWGTASMVEPNTVILHSSADDVVPIADSEELLRNSGLPESALVVVGTEHRLADPESLAAMLEAVEKYGVTAGVLANPVSHEAGVPNRFGVGTLLVISTMYAVLFAVWRFMKWTPIVLVWVALFFFAVGLGQMLMFNGLRPRRASMIVGTCTYLCMILSYVVYESYKVHAIPADPFFWLLFFLVNVPVGMLLGYIAGGLIASHFLVIDKLTSLRVRTKDIDPADGAGT